MAKAKASRTVSVAELRENSAGVVRRVRASTRPVKLTDRGILLALAREEREVTVGRGFSLDEVFEDADRLLARARK